MLQQIQPTDRLLCASHRRKSGVPTLKRAPSCGTEKGGCPENSRLREDLMQVICYPSLLYHAPENPQAPQGDIS